jgi:hypothetical protein
MILVLVILDRDLKLAKLMDCGFRNCDRTRSYMRLKPLSESVLKDTPADIPFRESFRALLCFGIYLSNGGGISQKVSQSLGLKDGVIELYNQNASTHQVYANITGVWASDRTKADGKYLILGNEGNEFVVSDGQGVYKTGEQIITSKVSTTVGEAAKTEIKNLSFDDEEALAKLNEVIAQLEELQSAYPGAARFWV